MQKYLHGICIKVNAIALLVMNFKKIEMEILILVPLDESGFPDFDG